MPEGLSDRAEDVLEPLFAVADLAGGEWPEPVRAAAVSLMGPAARHVREADLNLPLELLTDIQYIFVDLGEPDILPTKTLIEHLVAREDRPWAAFGRSEKPITGHRISRLLKGFDIESASHMWWEGRTVRGYRSASFVEAFSRYTGFKVSECKDANKTGPESLEIKVSGVTAPDTSKTAVDPDKHSRHYTLTLSTPDHAEHQASELCCQGGRLELRCKLCHQSPTYWERQSH
jgi:hypothetical protein